MVLRENELRQPANKRLMVLCIVFIVWSILGVDQLSEFWITKTKWWGLLVYILMHFGLAGMILRSAGLRLWSVGLCLLGLFIGGRTVLPTFALFTFWYWRGFV